MTPFTLAQETALITGGGSGLGLGIATAMAEAGARVILVGRRPDVLAEAAGHIGERASFIPWDINQLHEAGELVDAAQHAAGTPPTILVNNAGIHLKKTAVETSSDEFQSVLSTHLEAAHALTAAILPSMIERRHGNLLFISSMAAIFGIPRVAAYSAAKSALHGLVRALSVEVSRNGIRVNAIAPGWIRTPMMEKALSGDPARRDIILGRTPMGVFGDPTDIGQAAVYLCSPAAKFVTGAILPVDGGASIGF